jgi:predicted ATP-grasp superfamily ATP-dependent carboligase
MILAWLFAEYASELSAHYLLYQPSGASLLKLLDKSSLKASCDEFGIPTPMYALPAVRERSVARRRGARLPGAAQAPYTVLQRGGGKGHIVRTPAALLSFYEGMMAHEAHAPLIKERIPGVHHPMLQAYREVAAERVYSLSGFLSHEGEVVARAAHKVLQRPRRVGVGICFESAPVDPQALADVRRLCLANGYYGVFEVEFLRHDDRLELIDFNPRFYGQLGFDIGRELPLPQLVWLAAQRRDASFGSRWRAPRPGSMTALSCTVTDSCSA